MIPIPGRTASRAALLAALTLAVGGCGLSEELDRERNPDRAVPSVTASSAGTDPAEGLRLPEPPEAAEAELGADPTGVPSFDPTAACPASGVRMLPGPVEPAMGLRAMSVTLTNCGTKPYTLNGYPSLQVLDEDHDVIDTSVLEGPEEITTGVPDPGPHTVTVRPGKQARTSLVWRNTVTEVNTPAVNAPYLRLVPAKGEPAEVLTVDGGIDLGNTGRIGVTAWEKVVDDR
ncbi:DUF4232 domain-containing protein [Streptomyces sp. CA-210063]|uniref:DUF4232 domain-containing protein n=1 Tax=Streptomyces sp. CA-210063 TaxID=2801029 RepID=UPI00214C097D|nr:DUF4232 domain-containing protein [Streptomyces sp. CA-210063]UUU29715.1 DUF4232 domain-containing protein [Streptomyces sp. CA-210063]